MGPQPLSAGGARIVMTEPLRASKTKFYYRCVHQQAPAHIALSSRTRIKDGLENQFLVLALH